jgi:hypothetical protein
MKIEAKDYSPKPLMKRFADVHPGEFFRWEGRKYRCEGSGSSLLCIDNFKRYIWASFEALDREVAMLDSPSDERWRELTKHHFPTKMTSPATVPVRDMEPGQVFILTKLLDGVKNDRYLLGTRDTIVRLSDGKVYPTDRHDLGIPVNGKFVEEDSE